MVGQVCAHKCGALHDGLLTAVRQGHRQLREVHQHLLRQRRPNGIKKQCRKPEA